MKLTRSLAEVRLFLIGYADAPLRGDSSGLTWETLPMYALFRVGAIETPAGSEHIIGLNFSSYLRAAASKSVPLSSNKSREDFLHVAQYLPGYVRTAVISAYDTFSISEIDGDGTVLRVAILVQLKVLRKMIFSTEEGFGVFLGREFLEGLRLFQEEQSEAAQRAYATKQPFTFQLPAFSIREQALRIDLRGEASDLQFTIGALRKWEEVFRQQRWARWRADMGRVFGATVA